MVIARGSREHRKASDQAIVRVLPRPRFHDGRIRDRARAAAFANRMIGYEAYSWRLASADGKPVRASNVVPCAVDTSLEEERRKMAGPDRPSMVIVCSGINVEEYQNRSTFAWLREEYNRGVAIGGLCTGAHVLAAAGLLSNKRCAIHWENLPGFSEAFPKANVFADLFEVDQNIFTCAGGTAALDMMLKLIGDDFDDNLVNRVCEQVLTDRCAARPTASACRSGHGSACRTQRCSRSSN